MAMDFIISSKHGTDEETQVLAIEICSLNQQEMNFFIGVISGFICAIIDYTAIGSMTEPVLKEIINQYYLSMKKEGAFDVA